STVVPNDLSIDATRPDIIRAYISSSDTSVVVDEIIEIILETDQAGYVAHSETWLNDVNVNAFDLTFEDLLDGTYRLVYTVSDQDGSVSSGDLAINIVLIDPYGNESPAFNTLDPNNITIHTSRPSASITGSDTICYGDTSLISVKLGGMSPWDIVISEEDVVSGEISTKLVTQIRETNYQFQVIPELSTDYIIPRVNDSTGNTNNGIGRAEITVNQLPDVEIYNLSTVYNIKGTAVEIQYSPAGGVFSGPGIKQGNPIEFDPALAGTSDDVPHNIVYWYMDQNGCINTDTSRVYVIESIDSIVFERPVACFNENEFTIIGANASDSIGRFKLIPNIDSIITSVDTNQITLDPSKLKLDSDLDIQVIYTYTDLSGFELTVERTLHIEQLHEASINPIAEDEYCANYNAIDLGGFYGTQGIFGGTGVTGDSSQGYGFDPALADLGINRITYYYTSNNACRIGDSTVLIVYDAPVADFDIVDDCTPESGGTVIFNNNTYTGVSNQINWEWEFGDFINSGALNFSTNMAPTHFYKEQGTWTVDLEVTID
ncbi:hypothetical protein LCGC14_2374230, partial [marine sediment metagenome]